MRIRSKLYLLLVSAILASLAQAGQIKSIDLPFEGHTWTYHLYTPDTPKGGPSPLVLVFHGAGGGGKAYLEKNGWLTLADREGVVVAAPDGLPALPRMPANFRLNPRLWNSGQLKPDSPRGRLNDIGFVAAMLDDIAKHAAINTGRVFATGHSNGAGMTYLLGAELPARLRAIAPVMGLNSTQAAMPARAVPTFTLLGTSDPLNPMQGGTRDLPWGQSTTPPVAQGLVAWATALGCNAMPQVQRDDATVRSEHYAACNDQATFTIWYLKGQGHAWPGGQDSGLPASVMGPNTTPVNATEVIWSFFSGYR